MSTYRLSFDHAAASYGEPVLLDDHGTPYGPADVGLWAALPANFCGRVDAGRGVYWSGFGEAPDRMWRALVNAARAHPDLALATVYDAGKVTLHAA